MEKKRLRVFEAFAGIGAQATALERIGIDYEVVGISDWFTDAINCYDAIHCKDEPIPELPSKEEQIEYLHNFEFSKDSVHPSKIDKLDTVYLEKLYIANKRTKNMGSITKLKAADMPECDLLVYSIPCQDLSTGGKGLGMKKGSVLPIVMCFQSLILDMAGNVGTQSLAVTIRVLMDENLNRKDKFGLILKEMRIGFANGLFLGIMAFVFIGLYVCFIKGNALSYSFLISGCVGVSLMLAMVISSLVGTTIPLLFHKIKVDPAVASGPLITTVNDLVAVVTYYGLVWLFMIELLKI